MCESITLLFNLVAKWRDLASRTINMIQMIFKSGEGHIMGNCRTIILGIDSEDSKFTYMKRIHNYHEMDVTRM